MVKRVFIVHRWDGSPDVDWYPWLKKELEARKFQVEVPAMPNPEEPEIDEWVSHLRETVGEANKDTYFVGHSVGCQTILRYLETLSEETKIGGVIMVAGWLNLIGVDKEEMMVARPWIETDIQWHRIIPLTNNFVSIFSDNDPYVPIGDAKLFEEHLNARIVFESRKGHFTSEDNVTSLMVVLNEFMRMSGPTGT